MQILKLSLNSILIWIKLMHLPMEFWTPTCLSYVASGVGKPLYADSIKETKPALVLLGSLWKFILILLSLRKL
jgi:hypothetical protein